MVQYEIDHTMKLFLICALAILVVVKGSQALWGEYMALIQLYHSKYFGEFISDEECGFSEYEDAGIEGGSPSKHIAGGWEAREHEFPYQVECHTSVFDVHVRIFTYEI